MAGTFENKHIHFGSCEISDMFENDAQIGSEPFTKIVLIEKGSGIHRIFGQSVPCSSGEVYIIAPHTADGFFASDEDNQLSLRYLSFDASDWLGGNYARPEHPDYCYGVFSEGINAAYAKMTARLTAEVLHVFDAIEKEVDSDRFGACDAIGAYLSLLLIALKRCIETSIREIPTIPPKERGIMSGILRTVENRFSEPDLTLETIAAGLFVSPSYLSRLFKQYMGQTFSDFIRNYRIDRACRLLGDTEIPISEIALRCGYKDTPSFYRVFGRCKATTPSQYRRRETEALCGKNNYKTGENTMSNIAILNEISENLQIGKAKIVKELVSKALEDGIDAKTILEEGLISGMNIIGEKFKNNEIYIPEVLVAARALNMGTQVLKPHFGEAGVKSIGRVCIGTVQGDLHDIGKNLVKMMMEGKQLEVIDLGTDVSAEAFVQAAIDNNCQIICCSALLTTTMGVMKEVVDAATAAGIRDKVKIMIGGAPINEEYCKKIGADVYTVDAASAADAAVELCKAI